MNGKLKTDCARCCGLCCVVPPFDADQGFGFDKPAHRACRHLTDTLLCGIHHELAARGFPACAAFDCYGAGSWMTQVLFKGASWRTSPDIAQRMFALYPRYRALHELMWQLDFAISQVASTAAAPLRRRLHDIEALCAGSPDLVASMDVMRLRREVRSLLRGLADARQTPVGSTGSEVR